MSKAIDLARKCRLFDDDQEPLPEHLEAFYAAAQQELLDRLTAGVEVPKIAPGLIDALRSQKQVDEDGTDCGVNRQAVDEAITALTQLLEYGAALRALGAKEEREKLHPFKPARGEA